VNRDHRYDPDLNTVSDANDVHGHSSQEIGVQIDRENSNVDEPNIHDSSKTNDGNAEQTDSIIDGDVEQNDVSQNIIQGLQNKTVCKDVGMEKADETTNDPGKDLSIQGDVEMNNATLLEGSSVILGEQDIVFNGDDQISNSEEVKRNDDGDGGYGDNSEVENDSSDSSAKLTWKHMKKNQTKSSELLMLKMMMIEVTAVVSLNHQ
jgi:hypothetical protein